MCVYVNICIYSFFSFLLFFPSLLSFFLSSSSSSSSCVHVFPHSARPEQSSGKAKQSDARAGFGGRFFGHILCPCNSDCCSEVSNWRPASHCWRSLLWGKNLRPYLLFVAILLIFFFLFSFYTYILIYCFAIQSPRPMPCTAFKLPMDLVSTALSVWDFLVTFE